MERNKQLPSANPVKVEEPRTRIKITTVARQFGQRLFRVLFVAHILITAVLALFLAIRGVFYFERRHFHPKKWFPPLMAAAASSGIVAFVWQWLVQRYPSQAIKAAFCLSPLLTCSVGLLLVLIGSASSLAIGSVAVVFSISLSLYACWVNPRFDYATKILSESTAFPPGRINALVFTSISITVFYSGFLVAGLGGATVTGTRLDILFKVVILLSLIWSTQTVKNIVFVTVSRIKYIHFSCGADMETKVATRDTVKHLMESVILGSIIVPILTVIRGSARAVVLVAGGTDEFLFSCADCYSSLASTLVRFGNRWGFVQVGVYKKGLVQASMDTWDMFGGAGLERLIDLDLTGSFCFLLGVAGGSVCSLVGGTWTLVVHKEYATEATVYAFLIGYFMCRVALAWVQACVCAYYVVYAENPQSLRFNPIIPVRLQELQRYGN